MSIAIKKISERGEIVIPKSIREEQGISSDSEIEIISVNGGIMLIPLKKKLGELAGLFGDKGVKNIKDLDLSIHELLAGM